jgi:hypothetical protein
MGFNSAFKGLIGELWKEAAVTSIQETFKFLTGTAGVQENIRRFSHPA